MERSATLTSDYFSWKAEVALPTGLGGHHRLWHAYFDDRTPRHLIAGFVTALVDPAPVSRGHYDVPHSHLVTQVERGAQGEQLAAAHEARLKASRSAARQARRSAAPPTPPAITTARPKALFDHLTRTRQPVPPALSEPARHLSAAQPADPRRLGPLLRPALRPRDVPAPR
ncbi:DUF317 domain-containing protein [Streptomyces sp. SAS_270]|uniref:DUF317 domain-containing protein n=1 Tax=Streptomyces sp. SAS_270 TaxID=3412748 RepID=UPI00403C8F2A